jgi:hypothetical protein
MGRNRRLCKLLNLLVEIVVTDKVASAGGARMCGNGVVSGVPHLFTGGDVFGADGRLPGNGASSVTMRPGSFLQFCSSVPWLPVAGWMAVTQRSRQKKRLGSSSEIRNAPSAEYLKLIYGSI